MRNIEERGVAFTVYSGIGSVRRCLKEYAGDSNTFVTHLDLSDILTDRDEIERSEGYIFAGQAGIMEGMLYPMHGRYTSWNVQVVLTDNSSSYGGECEVVLDAIGDRRMGNNLSIRCSESYRDKIEKYIRSCFSCSSSSTF